MDYKDKLNSFTQNASLIQWIEEIKALCHPDDVYLCDGSKNEFDSLSEKLVHNGTFVRLNPAKRPGSFWCHTTPDDVARLEDNTFICSHKPEDAGPTNNWRDPKEMMTQLKGLFAGCMKGRTMYIIPFCMGPVDSPYARFGIEITDSAYVVCNMHLMTRMGDSVLKRMATKPFVHSVHSIGVPLSSGQKDAPWPSNPNHKYIVHFPEERSIWSFGSGYGGNALLGKKCFALRIASVIARDEGWLAEHMLILGITSPQGKKKYFAAAFPSACGKTNLAMVQSHLPGWKVECVGDDIAWMHFDEDGRLYAINPEAGFFGVAPGTSMKSNPQAMKTIERNAIFTNVALTEDGDVWWEGMTDDIPAIKMSWKGTAWTKESKEPAAHPNGRFTVAAKQCAVMDENWEKKEGVPISAIIFGGRRADVEPLVYEAFSWQHGVFLGASLASETTAAAKGEVGKLRYDPFAMRPFCGYHMGDYFNHWLSLGSKSSHHKVPSIFHVNWFKKSKEGTFLWPGFSENVRVLKWIFDVIDGKAEKESSILGYIPKEGSLDVEGLNLTPQVLKELFEVDVWQLHKELSSLKEHFAQFKDRLPDALAEEIEKLQNRID